MQAAETVVGKELQDCWIKKFQISAPVQNELLLFAYKRSSPDALSQVKAALPSSKRLVTMELNVNGAEVVVIGYETKLPITDTINLLPCISVLRGKPRQPRISEDIVHGGKIISGSSDGFNSTLRDHVGARASIVLRLAVSSAQELVSANLLPREARRGYIA